MKIINTCDKIKSDFADFYYSLAVAQAEFAEELIDTENKDSLKENKIKSEELKASAIANAQKYLELNPQVEDKEEIEEFIKDLTKIEKEEQPVLLKG